MSKAILVLDKMPEGCYEPDICPFRGADAETDEYICLITEEKIAYEGRPDWCPLKEMPEKINQNEGDFKSGFWYQCGLGWNLCIDEILDGTEN